MNPAARMLRLLSLLVMLPTAAGLQLEACGIDGDVTRVGRDTLNMDVDGGSNIRIDAWGVYGEATSQNIGVGDRARVFASRDGFGYDAWRFLDEYGEPACPCTQR